MKLAKNHIFQLITFFILLFLSYNLSYSQIPQLISYQGVLTDNSGNLVSNGNYNVTFNLYTVSTGGSSIWNETQTVTTNVGVFNVNLGSVTPFTIGFSSQYYLGVTIGGVEMSPRTQLTSAAYSMNGNPAGTVIAYVGTTAPTGYFLCDGSAVSRTTYSALFAVIGTAFGSGNGTTTFNLPDLRGRFIRGFDGTAGNDPDKTSRVASNTGGNTGNNIGTLQDDAFQGHGHKFTWFCDALSAYGSGGRGDWPRWMLGEANGDENATTGLNCRQNKIVYEPQTLNSYGLDYGAARYTTETRPENIYMNYIIKY